MDQLAVSKRGRVTEIAASVQLSTAPRLLVSVRSAREARAALAGGADVIDVKDPEQGSLGRARADVIAQVLQEVNRRRPVSAALGELKTEPSPCNVTGLAFCKWGLSGYGAGAAWQHDLLSAMRAVHATDPSCGVVPVAYADARRAAAPAPDEIAAFAQRHRCPALLLDTFHKDGSTLLDWLSPSAVESLCRTAGVPIALAGSLGAAEIELLRAARPSWFAVRGAACQRSDRRLGIDRRRVQDLARLLVGEVNRAKRES